MNQLFYYFDLILLWGYELNFKVGEEKKADVDAGKNGAETMESERSSVEKEETKRNYIIKNGKSYFVNM